MARVAALCSDLMFGSRLAAQVLQTGERLELLADAAAVQALLEGPAEHRPQLLLVDLTSEPQTGIALVGRLGEQVAGSTEGRGEPTGAAQGPPRTLGFYSHVEADVRERAELAGFDLVVPRSRMAREGAALVQRLLE
jgi:hypothetical protein